MNSFKKITVIVMVISAAVLTIYTFKENNWMPIGNQYLMSPNKRTPLVHQPHQHIYYLRSHKTGSTTIHNILAEYCRSHDLLPLMPSNGNHINQKGQFYTTQVKMIEPVVKYEMVFSHHIYDPKILNYLHDDVFRITSVREPFDNFVSAFLYYKNKWTFSYLVRVPTNDPITEFLRHPTKYDTKTYGSMTNNRQSMDLGFDLSKSFDDVTYIKEFIQLSDSRFDLVIPMEYFDEGLVIMKRVLHWNTEDILYYTKNAGSYYKSDTVESKSLEEERRKLHASFSKPDIMLYEHFLNRFKKQMDKEIGLEEEVVEFRNILVTFREFCDGLKESTDVLVIPAGKWNNEFLSTYFKCKMVSKEQASLIHFMKDRQDNLLV